MEYGHNPMKAAILGAGRMGRSIGGQLALQGVEVVLYDHTEHGRARAIEILKAELRDLVNSKYLTIADETSALTRVRVGSTLEDATQGADMVIEAIFEDLSAKQQLFAELATLQSLPATAILATNSINFTIEQITAAAPQRNPCCGVRFLHPVYFCPEVAICSTEPQVNANAVAALRAHRFEPFVEPSAGMGGVRAKLSDVVVQQHYSKQRQKTSLVHEMPQAVPQSDSGGWSECVICMTNATNCVLIPCGHTCCCRGCADTLVAQSSVSSRICPICRTRIENVRDRV